ncbi:exonuclease domain-containing protein [Streptomyces noursei]
MSLLDALSRPVLAGFDTETTGLAIDKDRIVSAALVTVNALGVEVGRREWLLNPGVLIPREATRIHGITTQTAVAEGTDARTGLEVIIQALTQSLRAGHVLVVQNAPFDLGLLEAEARRYGLVPLSERVALAPVLDPAMLARCGGVEGPHRLGVLCERFGVELEEAHTAVADARAAAGVAQVLLELPVFEGASPEELHVVQQDEARRRAQQRQQGGAGRMVDPWPVELVGVPAVASGSPSGVLRGGSARG